MSASLHSAHSTLQKNFEVPIHVTDLTVFDASYCNMKERFVAQMRKVEEDMKKLSVDLRSTQQSSSPESRFNSWAQVGSSLIQDTPAGKALKLQFDVSQFDPSEVTVKIVNDVLILSALHDGTSEHNAIHKEFHTEFQLPKGTKLENVRSCFSREGVLTVEVVLPKEEENKVKEEKPKPLAVEATQPKTESVDTNLPKAD